MKIKSIMICLLFCTLTLNACNVRENNAGIGFTESEETDQTGYKREVAGFYDSADTAVVTLIDKSAEKITLQNLQLGKKYTLKYDGATIIKDKYGNGLAMTQISQGEIVEVTFHKLAKRLNSILIAENAWDYSEVSKFEVFWNQKRLSIGSEEYKLDPNVVIVSNGMVGEIADLNSTDLLLVKGIDHTIYSILIDQGHGYLRLANEEYFIGGWIEVGQELIKPIVEDMLLVVPEGTYQVFLTNTGIETSREVTIKRDGEIELDVGDVIPEEKKFGQILFSVIPPEAQLFVNGTLTDYSRPVSLEYGIHQIIVKAEGYEMLSQFVKVGQEYANINIEMEETQEEVQDETQDSKDAVSANTVTSNNTVTAAVADDSNKIFIESPEGSEVYLDTNYVGIAPISFLKTAGTHVITLRKNGYVTKSYTIQVDSVKKDVTYSFSDLISES